MTAGHREAFRHDDEAAAPGQGGGQRRLLAARLAAGQALAGPADPALGPDGVLEVLAASVDRSALGLGWPAGHRWELELNTFKTYPLRHVVAHPAMDAAIIASARIAEAEAQAGRRSSGVNAALQPPGARADGA